MIFGFDEKKNKVDVGAIIDNIDERLEDAEHGVEVLTAMVKRFSFNPSAVASDPNQREFSVNIPNFGLNSVVIGINEVSKTSDTSICYRGFPKNTSGLDSVKAISSIQYEHVGAIEDITISFTDAGYDSDMIYQILFINY